MEFFNIFIHECGHALSVRFFGYIANKMSVGIGLKLFSLGGGKNTEIIFRICPFYGYTIWKSINMKGTKSKEVIIIKKEFKMARERSWLFLL